MELSKLNDVFFAECTDILSDMENVLLTLESGGQSSDEIDALFRCVHTLKGSSGVFGFTTLESFAGGVESLLAGLRSSHRVPDKDEIALLMRCRDHMSALLASANSESAPGQELLDKGAELTALLPQAARGSGAAIAGASGPQSDGERDVTINLSFAQETFRHGFDPMSFLSFLKEIGEIKGSKVLTNALPRWEDLDPEMCWIALDVTFHTAASDKEIAAVFDLLGTDCRLEIKALDAASDRLTAMPGALTRAKSTSLPTKTDARRSLVRVESLRLDRLVNLVGELVTSSAHIDQVARSGNANTFRDVAESLGKLVREIREGALQLRMVPVDVVFSRFRRIVHDASIEMGKDVDLVVLGADAELDRTITDRLSDPLLHLVRNAIDHGIEPKAERLRLGKPEKGRITLNAFHSMGEIVIEISDDGAGLDREKILRRARQMGLVGPNDTPSAREIDALIFAPGLSTREHVTQLSGRGVGMDVVAETVRSLRGTVQLESSPGVGTTTRIHLPLTLALLDGFLVRVGDFFCVFPQDAVAECVEASSIRDWGSSHGILDHRGEPLPYMDLGDVFQCDKSAIKRSVVVVRYPGTKGAFIVDRLLGSIQVVVKPAGKVLKGEGIITGTAILGDGSVAMVLSVEGLMERLRWSDVSNGSKAALKEVYHEGVPAD